MSSVEISPVSSRTDVATPDGTSTIHGDADVPIFFNPYQDAIAQADNFRLQLDNLENKDPLDVYFQLYEFMYETDIFGYTLDELFSLSKTSEHEKTRKAVTAFINKFQAQFFRAYGEFCKDRGYDDSLVSIISVKDLETFLKDNMNGYYAQQLALCVPDFDQYPYPEYLTIQQEETSKHYFETVVKFPRTYCLLVSKIDNKKNVLLLCRKMFDKILAGDEITSETSLEVYDQTLADPEYEKPEKSVQQQTVQQQGVQQQGQQPEVKRQKYY